MLTVLASELLGCLGYEGELFALFGPVENDTDLTPAFESTTASIDPVTLPANLRVDVALVRPLPGDAFRDVSAVLARLRDVHAGRVLLCPDQLHVPDSSGFMALGFEPQKSPSVDGLVFVWDPELADQPREWNDSRNWANPENFSKFRW